MSDGCFKGCGRGKEGVTHPPGTVLDLYAVRWHLPPQKRLGQELLAMISQEVMNSGQMRNQMKT